MSLPSGRKARDRRLGQLERGDDLEPVGLEHDELGRAPVLRRDRDARVRDPAKSFVTRCPSGRVTKLLYGSSRGNVRDATHGGRRRDGARGCRIRRGASRRRVHRPPPGHTGRPAEVGRARVDRLERERVDAFDERDGAVTPRSAGGGTVVGLAGDEHRAGGREARRDLERVLGA